MINQNCSKPTKLEKIKNSLRKNHETYIKDNIEQKESDLNITPTTRFSDNLNEVEKSNNFIEDFQKFGPKKQSRFGFTTEGENKEEVKTRKGTEYSLLIRNENNKKYSPSKINIGNSRNSFEQCNQNNVFGTFNQQRKSNPTISSFSSQGANLSNQNYLSPQFLYSNVNQVPIMNANMNINNFNSINQMSMQNNNLYANYHPYYNQPNQMNMNLMSNFPPNQYHLINQNQARPSFTNLPYPQNMIPPMQDNINYYSSSPVINSNFINGNLNTGNNQISGYEVVNPLSSNLSPNLLVVNNVNNQQKKEKLYFTNPDFINSNIIEKKNKKDVSINNSSFFSINEDEEIEEEEKYFTDDDEILSSPKLTKLSKKSLGNKISLNKNNNNKLNNQKDNENSLEKDKISHSQHQPQEISCNYLKKSTILHELIKEQNFSRKLQNYVQKFPKVIEEIIFPKIKVHILELSQDKFANYFLQQIICFLSTESIKDLFESVSKNIFLFSSIKF